MGKAAISVSLSFVLALAAFGQQQGSVRGTVADLQGGLVVDAEATLTAADGTRPRTARSDDSGRFAFTGVAPGLYTLRVSKAGFAAYENTAVAVAAGRAVALDVTLGLTIEETQVTVRDEAAVSTDPEASAGAVVLGERDIEALPDDPADLEAALRALAGPGSGPGGGEIFIDGFSGGRLPPAESIREVRINQNPFSSEFDRLGLGRIEILTKPGTEQLRGETEFEFEDDALNSRNPFSPDKPPFRATEFSGNIAGPLVRERISYFLDGGYGRTESNAIVNAFVLGPAFEPVAFSESFVVPESEVEFSPRFDIQLNERNTLTLRYQFERETSDNSGVGGFNLATRSFASVDTDHTFRLTETAVLSPSIVNETRFQYIFRRSEQLAASDAPTVQVLDAFTAGGANIGDAFDRDRRVEIFNSTSITRGRHTIKFGGRVRHTAFEEASPSNFAGTFTFTSIDQFRDTVLDVPGARPAQFTIAGGDPLASVSRTDVGLFIQDDWRYSPRLTLSLGLRYENQTNISSPADFAPRFAVAFAPGATSDRSPATVFRAGVGVFYERFGESLTLQAARFNGVNQQRFIVTNPDILDAVVFAPDGTVTNVPDVSALASLPQVTRLVDADLRSPYTVQAAFSVERRLPFNSSVSASYIHASSYRLLRSRNINAPLAGVRPQPDAGDVYAYESTGRSRQNQIVVNGRSRFADGFSVFANYAFGFARSDTDGAGTFPAFSYDLSREYGVASSDIRHRFTVGGNFDMPFGIELSPFVTFRTGIPFNITTGIDSNGDGLFTERPAFAADLGRLCDFGPAGEPDVRPCVVRTPFGDFDRQPLPGQELIPRNYGRGGRFFVTNLRVGREFEIGSRGGSSPAGTSGGGGGGGGGRRGGISDPFGSQRGGGSGPDSNSDDRPLFTVGVEMFFRNIFNTNNPGLPVGNLGSPFFGRPVSTAGGFGFGTGSSAAGNRRIEFELEFSF